MNKQQLFTELSIKIATLDMKLDKVLELLNNQQQWTVVHPVEFKSEPRIVRRNHGDFESVMSDEEFTEEFK